MLEASVMQSAPMELDNKNLSQNHQFDDEYTTILKERQANAAMIAPLVAEEQHRRIAVWQNFLHENQEMSEQNLTASTQLAQKLYHKEKIVRVLDQKISDRVVFHNENAERQHNMAATVQAEEQERLRRIAARSEEQQRTTNLMSKFLYGAQPKKRKKYVRKAPYKSKTETIHEDQRKKKQDRVLLQEQFTCLSNVLGVSCGRGKNQLHRTDVLDQAMDTIASLRRENALLFRNKEQLIHDAIAVRDSRAAVPMDAMEGLSFNSSSFGSSSSGSPSSGSSSDPFDFNDDCLAFSVDACDLSLDLDTKGFVSTKKQPFDWTLGGESLNLDVDLSLSPQLEAPLPFILG